ncbi:hypothetical protein H0E87_016399 [Populus deltoides]|uniref:RRM domain-containing protein n=1 Tax=Populus deltoides TaxID=3696 RepID=A0A8T2Y9B5_POPDE|nr:hypothetical protein H0E87_016399 [Populus deltoides]
MSSAPQGDQIAGRKYYEIHQNFAQNLVAGYALNPLGFLQLLTEAAAKRALVFDGSDMGGFYLKIQPYRTTRANKGANFAPGIVEGFNRIYVGNLSWDITDDGLRKFFSDCKNHLYVSETGGFRGYGHVDFSNNASLMKALKLDQQIFCGRRIKCSAYGYECDEVNDGVPSISSGKMKRRTCYECGEN